MFGTARGTTDGEALGTKDCVKSGTSLLGSALGGTEGGDTVWEVTRHK